MAGSSNDKPLWVTIDVTGEGEEPMLCNPMTREQLIAIGEKRTVPWPKDRPISEQADEKAKLLLDVEGRYGFPRQWLIGALRAAGRAVETGLAPKQKISTATSTLLRSFMRIDPICMSTNADGEKVIPFSTYTEYVRDVRKGVGGTATKKVAVPIVRPRFDPPWAFQVRITVAKIDSSRIRQLFEVAGASQGLGDFRPGVGGEFGCFGVTGFTVYRDAAEVPAFELVTSQVAPTNGKVPAGV